MPPEKAAAHMESGVCSVCRAQDKNAPKTTCLPSSHEVLMVQMKNCEPLVFGPALAMERIPGPVCLSLKFSSANFSP